MGRWDETIYGGDVALKWKEDIYEICGANEYDGDDHKTVLPIPVESLKEKVSEIRETIDNSDKTSDEKNIGYQVLGAISMHAGYDISDSEGLKERILLSIEDDEWKKDRPLRRIVLNNYKKTLEEYEFSEPIDITKVNLFEEAEEEDTEDISKEFKDMFGLINSRIKKLNKGKEESSGNSDYDEGFAAAADEEIDFLTDFKELLSKQELMGVLLERISKGMVGTPSGDSGAKVASESTGSLHSNTSTDAGRADVQPG